MTIKEFSEKFEISYTQAAGAVAFLSSLGIIEKKDEITKKAGRGKPSAKYEFPVAKTIVFDEEGYQREKLKRSKGK